MTDIDDLEALYESRGRVLIIRSMPEMVAALRTTRDERQLTLETLDAIAGWPDGYAGKLLAKNPIKNLGWSSLGLGLGALGKMLLMVDDPVQIQRVKRLWTPRARPVRHDEHANAVKA
jgi:hypothetical protein